MQCIFMSAGLAVLLAAAPAAAQQNGANPLDAGFTKWDKNKDGFLDAEELAKAFRGPNAKVIEDKPGAKDAHPDHAFLATWDADKDGKISKAEFDKYEAKVIADLRASANRKVNYTRTNRTSYRKAYSHRGYSNRGRSSYGSNPYAAQMRSAQRSLAQQRQFYTGQMRYRSYSPNSRGGYRGTMAHRGGFRRR